MIILLILFNLVLFWPIFTGLVPLPTDALAGAYEPWAGQFWGFVAGIPYKNISLTDVFSQLYPWRELAMDLIRKGAWPLWNQFSFSGYPLLANWQSAPFYPLNILMLIFGNLRGYGLMVFLQPILAGSFMYLFLKQIRLSRTAALFGALISAYSGFAMTYLEYATLGQIMAWLPLILYFFEKYFENRKIRFMALAGLCFFPVFTGGFFQPAFYVLLIACLYWLFRARRFSLLGLGLVFILIGALTAALQLFPTVELLGLSIRSLDNNIVEYHYGLLPVQNLISFLAPDFFGNPATGNYWGVMQYQEATGYFSAIALALALVAFFSRKRDWRINLFSALFAGSLVLAFNNPIGRLIYQLKVPLLATGYASRWFLVTAFSGAFLAAVAFEKFERKAILASLLASFGVLAIAVALIWGGIIPVKFDYIPVALRNLVLPLCLLAGGIFVSIVVKNKNWAKWLLLGLVALDLGRFAMKFTPFSETEYTTRKLPVFEYIKNRGGFDRVMAQEGPILPANTWIYPRLYSPAGYDPLLVKDYAVFFQGVNMGVNRKENVTGKLGQANFTRYLYLVNPNSEFLDLLGVKYLLAIKWDGGRVRPWGKINEAYINLERYRPVFEDGATVILENINALPRVSLYYRAEAENDTARATEKLVEGFDFRTQLLINKKEPKEYRPAKNDVVTITSYEANRVELKAETENGAYLLLTDTYFPGWKVTVNGERKEILRAFGTFRAVEVGPGESRVIMVYKPESFKIGGIVSAFSLAVLLFITLRKRV
jgi:hypothetical protein